MLLDLSEEALGTSKHTGGTELCSNLQKLRVLVAELRAEITLGVLSSVFSQILHFLGSSVKSESHVFQGSTQDPRRYRSCHNTCCWASAAAWWLCWGLTWSVHQQLAYQPQAKNKKYIFFFF